MPCIAQRGGGRGGGGGGDGVGAVAVDVNRDVPEGHEQRAGTAGHTGALSCCPKGPGVHQEPLPFSPF